MIFRAKSIVVTLTLLVSIHADATKYFISTGGNDSNAGTSERSSWQTIHKLNAFFKFLSPGDSVLFNRGDAFYGTIIPTKGFTEDSPLFIGAYGTGANPMITGLTNVNSWANVGGNIWESTSAVSALNDLNMVVINGINTPMGRYPNSGWLHIDSHAGNTSLTSTSLNAALINWTGADEVMKVNNFYMQRNTITSASGSTINYSPISSDKTVNNYGFFIENDARTLDIQNEWYYNPSTKKIRIYSKGLPRNVQVSTLDTLVYLIRKSYIIFDHLDFTGSNRRAFYIGSCDGITIQYCNFRYHGLDCIWGGNNYGLSSANFNFNHNTVKDINSKAIYLASEFVNPHIWYNKFNRIGIYYGMFKQEDARYNFSKPFAIISAGWHVNGCDIAYNIMDSTGYNAIDFAQSHGHLIHNNEISHFCLLFMDGAGIYGYSGTADFAGSKIYNNIIHDGIGDNSGTTDTTVHLAEGIYLDEGLAGAMGYTNNIEVYKNSCFNNALSGIYSNGNKFCNFHDNTCYNNSVTQFLAASSGDTTSRYNILKNNIFVARTVNQFVVKFSSNTSQIDFFSLSDSNYFAKPINDNADVFFLELNGYKNFRHFSLVQWQSFSGLDSHSRKSPKAITDVSNLRFDYNATDETSNIHIPGNVIDVKGAKFTESVPVPAWSSAITIK